MKCDTMRQNEAPEGLSSAQAATVEAMLAGKTVTGAATAAGVGRATVDRWLKDTFAFQAELNRGRREIRRATFGNLERLVGQLRFTHLPYRGFPGGSTTRRSVGSVAAKPARRCSRRSVGRRHSHRIHGLVAECGASGVNADRDRSLPAWQTVRILRIRHRFVPVSLHKAWQAALDPPRPGPRIHAVANKEDVEGCQMRHEDARCEGCLGLSLHRQIEPLHP